MNFWKQRRWLWVLVNLLGIALYLYLASSLWVQPGTEGEPGGPGDAFYWLICLLPFRVAFTIFNLWAAVALFRRRRQRSESIYLTIILLVMVVLWLGVFRYDQSLSQRVIDPRYTLLNPPPSTQGSPMLPFLLAPILALSPAPTPLLPSTVGTTWHYKALVQWTGETAKGVQTASLDWQMSIVAARRRGSTTVLVVKGFPADLCWYEPSIKPRLSVLTLRADGLWIDTDPGSQDMGSLMDAALAAENPGGHYLSGRPKVGDSFRWPADMDQSPYRRRLEARVDFRGHKGWQVVLSTGPDDETLAFVPGTGVTTFEYNHHGTPASVRAELQSVTGPAR